MPSNTTVGSTLLDEDFRRIVLDREQECLDLQMKNSTALPEPYCRITFDGWSCWPNTPAGTTVYAPCPNFITGFDASQNKRLKDEIKLLDYLKSQLLAREEEVKKLKFLLDDAKEDYISLTTKVLERSYDSPKDDKYQDIAIKKKVCIDHEVKSLDKSTEIDNNHLTIDVDPQMKEKITWIESENSALKEKLTQSMTTIQSLKEELSKLTVKYDDLKAQYKEKCQCLELQQQIEELNKNLEICQDEKERLKKLLDENNDKLLEFEDRLKSAKDIEQEKDNKIMSLQREMKFMIQRNEKLERENEQQRTNIHRKNNNVPQKVRKEGTRGIEQIKTNVMAHKYCDSNGTWFRHPESNQVWSNYTTCVNLKELSWQQGINGIYEAGYAISLLALLLSLGILTYFRSLKCARITLHMNLFASFAVNNALWLVWYRCIVANTDLLLNNGVMCRLLHIILHYFLLTNYAWMLCEGFYLHTLLVSAFTSEHKLVKWLEALGWLVPAVFVTIYASLRALSDDPADTEQCWISEGNYMNALVYPVCVSTVLNILFLINIVRVLVMKLRAGPTIGTQSSRSILQAFRATMLLVPLLGLHYLAIPFRPPKNHPWEQFYEILSAITASFQGLCVAILFCFCNGEVIAQFKRKWEGNILLRNRTNSCTAASVL